MLSSALPMQSVMSFITFSISCILSTILRLELSTSCIAESTTPMCSPICVESLAIPDTLSLTCTTLVCVVCISSSIVVIDFNILLDVFSRCPNAVIILSDDSSVSVLKFLISSATTAKPFPASPALAASIEALSANRLVCELISPIVPVSVLTLLNSCWNSLSILSTSPDNSAIVLVLSTTSASSFELVSVCSTDSLTSCTTSLISEATFST